MIKLTKIFSINQKLNNYIEIVKEILGNKEYILINTKDIVINDNEILINASEINAKKDFFRKIRSI